MNDHAHSATGPQNASTIWICPMHAKVQQERPGSCPQCGMHLMPDGEAANVCHDHHAHQSRADSLQMLRHQQMMLEPADDEEERE